MNSYRIIDKDHWPRRELFDFYQKFDNPCFNITVNVDAQELYSCSRDRRESFFQLALYAILRAANAVPQLKQRIIDGTVIEFEKIAVMSPIMTEHEMFRQIWCEYAPNFSAFANDVAPKIEDAKRGTPSPMEDHGEDFLCASCVPWVHFSSITSAEYNFGQAVPLVAWGMMKNGIIPIACKFNHSFIDGLHVGRFFDEIEKGFTNPDSLWTP